MYWSPLANWNYIYAGALPSSDRPKIKNQRNQFILLKETFEIQMQLVIFKNYLKHKIVYNLMLDTIVTAVIEQFKNRSKIGKEKYGTDLDRQDLTLYEWIQHAQEEHMDAILYLEKIKKTLNEGKQIRGTDKLQ